MTKIPCLILLVFVLFSCGKSSIKLSDKRVEAEKKRIAALGLKSATEFTCLWVDSIKKYSDQKIKSSYMQYDHSGNATEEVQYDTRGNEYSKNIYEFNDNGKIKSYSKYSNGELFYKIITEFDKDGKETSDVIYFKPDAPRLKDIKLYNGDILKKEIRLDISKNDTDEIIYYNEKGKRTEDKNFDGHTLTKRITYDWTPDERTVTEKEFNADASIRQVTAKQFDKDGNEIKKTEMSPYPKDTLWNCYLTDYDNQGNKIKELWYRPSNDTIYIQTWKYDNQNHMTEMVRNDFDYFDINERKEVSIKNGRRSKSESVTKYEVKYDEKENIIKADVTKKGQPQTTSTYQYEYWKQ